MSEVGFIRDPRPAGELPPEEFRRLGYRVIDMMADYFRSLDTRPVLPSQTATQMQALFGSDRLTRRGEPAENLLDDWEGRVLPNLTAIGSPRHFVYVTGSGTMIGALAEALAASVNTNAGGVEARSRGHGDRTSDCTLAGRTSWLSADCGGIFVSGATMANFSAILTALRNTSPNMTRRRKGCRARHVTDGSSSTCRITKGTARSLAWRTCSIWDAMPCASCRAAVTSRWIARRCAGCSMRTLREAIGRSVSSPRSAQ